MFRSILPRRWVGAAAVLLAGMTAGCRHAEHHHGCSAGDACAAAPATPPPPVPQATPVPGAPRVTAAPRTTPYLTTLPPVRNERYVNPTPAVEPEQPQIVVAAKPKLLPPVNDPTAPVTTQPITIPPIRGYGEPPARRSFPDITARPEFAHAADYSSLTGELSFVPHKNQWRLRYTSIDDEDKYGGAVTLDANQQMKGLRSGQLVRVQGELVDKDSHQPSPLYRVAEIAPVQK